MLIGSLFFLIFFLVGSLFVVLMGREAASDLATFRWERTPATVLASGVEEIADDDDPYRLAVEYVYRHRGREYTGRNVARNPPASSSYDSLARRASRYPPGATVDCYVDPERPDQAVLLRRPPYFALLLPLPLIFVAIGAIGLIAMWRRSRPEAETVSISSAAGPRRRGLLVPIILGGVFTAVGGALFVALGVIPTARLLASRSWHETRCTIVSSTVRSHSSDDSTTYSIDILYEYRMGDRVFRSNRYDFANFSSSGIAGKREIVERYPTGSEATCFVDPEDPSRSVLNRDFRPSYLVGLAPLVFLVAGVAALHWGLRRRRAAAGTSEGRSAELRAPEGPAGPRVLEPGSSRFLRIVGAVIFTLIWNGIVGVFLYQAVREWQRGSPDWFLTLFLVPFVLVGVASFGFIAHSVLAAFNPRPELTLTPGEPRLGDLLRVGWTFHGRSGRIQHLGIVLEGHEEATYQRGTDTRTDREVFATLDLLDTESQAEIPRGAREVRIPEDTMHSFDGGNNRIVWTLKVRGEVPRFPDVNDAFEIQVRPMAISRMAP
jgi:hypothetical protein